MNEVGEGILDRDQGLKDYSAKNSMACSEGTEQSGVVRIKVSGDEIEDKVENKDEVILRILRI